MWAMWAFGILVIRAFRTDHAKSIADIVRSYMYLLIAY